MRPYWYILAGVLLLLVIVSLGQKHRLFPGGIFNSAQVLSVIVLSAPDNGNNGGNSGNSGGSKGGGGGGGGGGGAVVPPTLPPSAITTNGTCTNRRKGDINCDGKVSITDFSLLAYWYKRTLTPQAIAEGVDLNSDGKVTLADFSILAYYWNT